MQRIPGRKDEIIRSLTWMMQPIKQEDTKVSKKKGTSSASNHNHAYKLRERLFAAGLNGVIYEVNFETARKSDPIDSYGGALWDLRAVSHQQLVAAACDDGLVRLFRPKGTYADDMEDPEFVKALKPYSSKMIPPSSLVSEDPVDKGLEFEMGLAGSDGRVLSVAWHPTESALFAGSSTGSIVGWDLRKNSSNFGRAVIRMQLGTGDGAKNDPSKSNNTMIWRLQVLADFSVVSGDSLGHIQVWDGRSGTLKHTFRHHDGDILSLSLATPYPEYGICRSEVNSAHQTRLPFINNCKWIAAGVDGKVSVMHAPSRASKKEIEEAHDNLQLPGQLEWAVESFHRGHSHDIRASVAGVCPAVTAAALQKNVQKKPHKKRKRYSQLEDLSTATMPSLVITGGDDCQLCVTDLVSMERNRRPHMFPPLPSSHNFGVASSEESAFLLVRHDAHVEVWEIGEKEQVQAVRLAKVCLSSGSNLISADIAADGSFVALLNSSGLRVLNLDYGERDNVNLELVSLEFDDLMLNDLVEGDSATRSLTVVKFLPNVPKLCALSSDGVMFIISLKYNDIESQWEASLEGKHVISNEKGLSFAGLPLAYSLEGSDMDPVSEHLYIAPIARFPPSLSNVSVSEDGKHLCVNDISNLMHLLNLGGKNKLSQSILPRKSLAVPVSHTFANIKGSTCVFVALSSFRVVLYDASKGIFSEWTGENYDRLPSYFVQKSQKGLRLHSSAHYVGGSGDPKIVVASREFLCSIDPTMKPQTPWKVKSQDSQENTAKYMNGRKYESQNFRINDSFYDVCYCASLPGKPNHLVVVESDGTKLIQHLPSELARRQYGM